MKMSKDQILRNADACADERRKLLEENKLNDHKIAALTNKEQELRKEAAEYSSPEQIFLDIIEGCTIKIDKDRYPDSIFLFKGDDWMFEIEDSTVWCRWSTVWNKISIAIYGDYGATQAFIRRQLEQHFKMRGARPKYDAAPKGCVLEQHFKMRGVTPSQGCGRRTQGWNNTSK